MPNNSSNRSRPAMRGVAIDVGATSVRAVEVEVRDGIARVIKRGEAPLGPDVWRDLASHRAHLAEAIRTAVRVGGISTSDEVVAALPRRLTTLKTVQLPKAPPEQMAGMVRFEAPQHIPFPLEMVQLAYELLPDESDELALALLAASRRTIVADVAAAFELAGLDLGRLTVTSLGIAEALGSGALPVAAIRLDGPELEVVVVSAGRLLYSRAASAPDGGATDAWLLEEIERTLAAYTGEVQGQPVSKILVIGERTDAEALERALGERLGVPVERFASRLIPSSEADAGRFTVAAGLALIAPVERQRLNLLPETRADRRAAARQRGQQIAAMIAVVLVIFAGAWWAYRSDQEDRAEHVRAVRENHRLEAANKALATTKSAREQVVKQFQLVETGLARPLPVVEVLKAVSDASHAGTVTLTQLSFERPASVTLQGTAPQAAAAMDLLVSLQKSPAFGSVRLGYVGDARADTSAGAAPKTPTGKPDLAKKAASERVTFTITGIVRPIAPTSATAVSKKPARASAAIGASAKKPEINVTRVASAKRRSGAVIGPVAKPAAGTGGAKR